MPGEILILAGGLESVVVKNTSFTPAKEVTAEVRGSIYVARALEPKDGGNNLTVTATDKAGVIQPLA
ncbi:MAG: hypothetical protein Q8Q12_16265 [bacterium]|nr:hypothetical protein [bacterium]